MLYYFIPLLPCFVCFFWAITLFCEKKINFHSRNIWIATAILMGLRTYVWSFYFSGIVNYGLFYKLDLLETVTSLLLLPLFFLGLRLLMTERPLKWREYLYLLPALIIGISMASFYMIIGEEKAITYIREIIENEGKITTFTTPIYRLHHFISIKISNILILIQITFILIYTTIRLVYYRNRLNEFFSNPDKTSAKNNRTLLWGVYIILFLSLITYKERFYYSSPPVYILTITVLWSIVIYFMGYNVHKLKYAMGNLANNSRKVNMEAVRQEYVSLQDNNSNHWNNMEAKRKRKKLLDRFKQSIENDKIFLQPQLRLDKVARLMLTNRTYISRMINEEFQCTFSDYINGKRIEYAQMLMRSNPNFTQEQIAELSGFSHTSSFSRTFKRQAGMTFREWQRKNLSF